ncbi:MAG: GGDEF domain-containing protein, partial [Clostridiales bacterium]|nr:GGDEF domain-containing protein [Clostridiales bacterium]
IANHRLLDQLKIMGSFDMLTGVKNRNAMNQRVDRIVAGEEKLPDQNAILFVDLNGLKQVNDNKGHDNGDVFLKNTANILKENFPDTDIFRAGGDEFMVLATDISKEEIEEKVSNLKSYRTKSKDVSFSLGYCPFDGTSDIRQAMSIADKKMYDDKRLFYEQNPDYKRG